MGLVIDPKAYIIGAAEVYYRAIGAAGPWSSIGATVDDVVFRVNQTTFNPSETFNGVLEPIREMDYISKAGAEAEFTMPEFAGSKLALAVLGAQSTTLADDRRRRHARSSTTLAAAAAIGDTVVKVVAVTNAAVGDYIRINVAGALAEYRRIDVVGTAGAGGTGLGFRDPLLKAHANGVAVVETVGDGKTEITPGTVRRQPLSAYNDFVARRPEPVRLLRALPLQRDQQDRRGRDHLRRREHGRGQGLARHAARRGEPRPAVLAPAHPGLIR